MNAIPELGRPSLQQFIVAYRHAERGWPKQFDDELDYARQRYDAGTHIMCQGRDGDYIIQYLIPRTGKPKPHNWFHPKTWGHVRAELENKEPAS